MKQNIGTVDRVIRLIVGTVTIAAGVYFQNWWGAIGLVFIATAAIRVCPPYILLGVSTCKTKDSE